MSSNSTEFEKLSSRTTGTSVAHSLSTRDVSRTAACNLRTAGRGTTRNRPLGELPEPNSNGLTGAIEKDPAIGRHGSTGESLSLRSDNSVIQLEPNAPGPLKITGIRILSK